MKRTQKESEQKRGPPIEEIDFHQKTLELEIKSQYGDIGSEKSESSKAKTMKTLPSFQGDYEARSDIKKLPSHKKQVPPVFDMINLSALLAAPIKCTLPLADILKVKPELWKDVGKCLERMGIHVPITKTKQVLKAMKQKAKVVEPIPVNKVRDYCEGRGW